jgi:hypothetical protein
MRSLSAEQDSTPPVFKVVGVTGGIGLEVCRCQRGKNSIALQNNFRFL